MCFINKTVHLISCSESNVVQCTETFTKKIHSAIPSIHRNVLSTCLVNCHANFPTHGMLHLLFHELYFVVFCCIYTLTDQIVKRKLKLASTSQCWSWTWCLSTTAFKSPRAKPRVYFPTSKSYINIRTCQKPLYWTRLRISIKSGR